MSIVPLSKVTVCGPLVDKARVLLDLQEMGCLHLVPLNAGASAQERGPSTAAGEALRFLEECPHKRRQMRSSETFDANAVQERALQNRERLRELADQRDMLRKRIQDLRPWGDFQFPKGFESKGLRLWFYLVPRYQLRRVEASGLLWQTVGQDNRFSYVAVISPQEPEGMPVPRTHTGAIPLSELQRRLEGVELETEDLEVERSSLTRWLTLFQAGIHRLEDRAALVSAFVQTFDRGPVFAVQGWAPRDRADEFQAYAEKARVVVRIEEPTSDDYPPTLLRNPPALSPGEDLVQFYMTPEYGLWDPSAVVLASFALFFAMIISDAGYAALMAVGLLFGWKALGRSAERRRMRTLFTFLATTSLVWGVFAGSYFGLAPTKDSLLAALNVVDLQNNGAMMRLSIWIGALHVALANLAGAWRVRRTTAMLAPVGWVVMIAGALALYESAAGARSGIETLQPLGWGALGLGGLAVLFFTGDGEPAGKRALSGLLGLTRISNAFGDVLSYLRLFALGLASASLAVAFNDLARQIVEAIPGPGYLLAGLVLVVGHGLNLVLAVVSGFVHGLRLNVIEFFNWGLPDEGRPFQAFRRKEATQWSN